MENGGVIPADGSRFIVIDIGQKGLEGNIRAHAECKASKDLSVTIRWDLLTRLQSYFVEQNPCRIILFVYRLVNFPVAGNK